MPDKKLTPIMELIEWIDEKAKTAKEKGALFSELNYLIVKNKAKELLEKERQMVVEFAEWIRTFKSLDKKDGFWILEKELSTEELYEGYLLDRERWIKEGKQN